MQQAASPHSQPELGRAGPLASPPGAARRRAGPHREQRRRDTLSQSAWQEAPYFRQAEGKEQPAAAAAGGAGGEGADAESALEPAASALAEADGGAGSQPSETSNGAGLSRKQQAALKKRQGAAKHPHFATALGLDGKKGKDRLDGLEQPPESGILPEPEAASCSGAGAAQQAAGGAAHRGAAGPGAALHPGHVERRKEVSDAWLRILRWSKVKFRQDGASDALAELNKVVVFGGGSFGTAMGVALARQRAHVRVSLLLRDPYVCHDINTLHRNTRYLPEYELPASVTATTSAAEAVAGAQYAIHAVPVQHSRALLTSLQAILPPDLPIISVSKGLEVGTGQTMSQLIPSALGRKQPVALLSGPSFAREVMDSRPTGIVAASRDVRLAQRLQQLFASPYMRVNTSSDVVGVEVCGALKNVLALAAGIVEGLELGHNALAALISQGCAEIRWLAEKMGASPATVAGLSGLGDIMLTCYGALSRNRAVGLRLGQGEALADIVASSKQVAEGVTTAGSVVLLARRYRVSLPVLTAVAQVVDGNLSPKEAVYEIMMLPQVEER